MTMNPARARKSSRSDVTLAADPLLEALERLKRLYREFATALDAIEQAIDCSRVIAARQEDSDSAAEETRRQLAIKHKIVIQGDHTTTDGLCPTNNDERTESDDPQH